MADSVAVKVGGTAKAAVATAKEALNNSADTLEDIKEAVMDPLGFSGLRKKIVLVGAAAAMVATAAIYWKVGRPGKK